jgi:hypothetical protein
MLDGTAGLARSSQARTTTSKGRDMADKPRFQIKGQSDGTFIVLVVNKGAFGDASGLASEKSFPTKEAARKWIEE